jgi:hypothetical protein
MNPRQLAVSGVVMSGGLAAVNSLAHGHMPPLKVGVGVAVGGLLMAVLADFAPEVAAPLGALVLVGTVIRIGPDLFDRTRKALA